MGGNAVKKPKQKGKNRLFVGECFGMKTSPKIMKTWERGWRSAFTVGGKRKPSGSSGEK